MNKELMQVRDYMLAVRNHIRNGDPAPPGYEESDRDFGYRSALRRHRINMTKETTAIERETHRRLTTLADFIDTKIAELDA